MQPVVLIVNMGAVMLDSVVSQLACGYPLFADFITAWCGRGMCLDTAVR